MDDNRITIEKLLAILGKIEFEQITDSETMTKWVDGDWGEYWYLFRTKDDNVRLSIIDSHKSDKTYITILHCEDNNSNEEKFYGGLLSAHFNFERLSVDNLVKLLEKFNINFKDKDFKFTDVTWKPIEI